MVWEWKFSVRFVFSCSTRDTGPRPFKKDVRTTCNCRRLSSGQTSKASASPVLLATLYFFKKKFKSKFLANSDPLF